MKNSALAMPATPSLNPSKIASKKDAVLIAVLPASESGKWQVVRHEDGRESVAIEDQPGIRKSENGRTVFGWSCREVITLPVWIADSGSAAEMIALELELRGLGRPGKAPIFGSDEVLKENGRVLYAVHLLVAPNTVTPVPGAGKCDAAARWISVEPDSLHFWKEQGSWVYGLTRGKILVYTESLRTAELSETVFAGIRRVIERFRSEGVLRDSLVNAWFFDPVESGDLESARNLLEVPARQSERRPPVVPSEILDLPSNEVVESRKKRGQFAQIRLGLLAAAALVLVLALVAAAALVRDYRELKKLESQIAGQTDEVSRLIGIAKNWQVIESAVEPPYYPLDILRDCAAQLPETGTRFTAVSIDGPEIIIQGEAATHPAAFLFADNLKKAPALADYEWEVPQPTMLPNNTASFQMSGLRKTREKP